MYVPKNTHDKNTRLLKIIQYLKYDNDIRNSIHYLDIISKNEHINLEIFGKLSYNKLKIMLINKNITEIINYSLREIIDVIINNIVNEKNIEHKKLFNFIHFLSDVDYIKSKHINYEIIILKLIHEFNYLFE